MPTQSRLTLRSKDMWVSARDTNEAVPQTCTVCLWLDMKELRNNNSRTFFTNPTEGPKNIA
eukprot:6463688-Amphidinium_carterae.2